MSLPLATLPAATFPLKKAKRTQTRVLIVSDHPTESRDVATNLRRLDLDVQLALFDGKTLSAIPNQAPDAVLCHLTDFTNQGPRLAKVVRAHFHPIPVPVIGAMSRPCVDSSKEFDSTLFAPMHASQIANRVNAMIRLGVMETEITRRLETLSESFDEHPEIGNISPNHRFRVLFIGKASPAFMVIINALQDKGVDVVAAFTSFSAFDYLHGEPFDAVVMNALEQTEPAFSISEAMRKNSQLYHTPTLFLIDQSSFQDHDTAYERGARDLISVDADPEEIGGRILELANYHRVHEQLKLDMLAMIPDVVLDASQAAFSKSFLESHLPRLLADASIAQCPVTLIAIQLRPESLDRVMANEIDAGFNQLAALITNLVRLQDVVCRWDENTFVLAFYNTNKAGAEGILGRINSLIECSAYENSPGNIGALTFSSNTAVVEIKKAEHSARDYLTGLMSDLDQDIPLG